MCVGGSGNITCGFQGGSRVFTFSLEGGVRQNVGNESRSQPPPPPPCHLNNERSLSGLKISQWDREYGHL